MQPAPHEETLDPADWDELRRLGHQMVDDMMAYLATVRERPVWQALPDPERQAIMTALPRDPSPYESVYRDFKEFVLPYPNGNIHPRFWGWVQGTGTPFAMLADMLASGLNPHMAGFEQAPAAVEETVMTWLKQIMGFPPEATGLLTTGGTMANLIGLAVARQAHAGPHFRETGSQFDRGEPLVAYASSEMHSWARKSMELLGLGNRALRIIEADGDFRLPLDALRRQIAEDRGRGLRPFCVLATAGTVNTGAIDDLMALADLAEDENLWLHVDGAFGALAVMSPHDAQLVRGLERADSVAFDLHKWMYLPFEVGCVLVRNGDLQRETFALSPSYLAPSGRGIARGPMVFADLGIELTRNFKALKVWMSLKAHGTELLGRLIGQNIDQARYLAKRIEQSAHLRVMAPVSLNVVCFRFEAGVDEDALDDFNLEVLLRLQESGIAAPSGTRLHGRFALRVAIVNHRSVREDFDLLVATTEDIGLRLLSERTAEKQG